MGLEILRCFPLAAYQRKTLWKNRKIYVFQNFYHREGRKMTQLVFSCVEWNFWPKQNLAGQENFPSFIHIFSMQKIVRNEFFSHFLEICVTRRDLKLLGQANLILSRKSCHKNVLELGSIFLEGAQKLSARRLMEKMSERYTISSCKWSLFSLSPFVVSCRSLWHCNKTPKDKHTKTGFLGRRISFIGKSLH